MELSIILPVYNESKIIRQNLENINDFLQTLDIEYEVIIVNDGSTDDTLQQTSLITEKHTHVISYTQNRGKGYAVNRGMTAAHGQYRLFMDMDLSTELAEIPKFLHCVRLGNCDICIGNRYSTSLATQKKPWHRALFGKTFSLLSSICTGYQAEDFTCGFKIFSAKASDKIFPRQHIYGWAFDTELISIAHQQGLRIHQESIVWHHHNGSKVNFIRAIPDSLIDLFRICYWTVSKEYIKQI